MGELYVPEVIKFEDVSQYCPMTEASARWNTFKSKDFKLRCTRKLGRRRFLLPREIIEFIKDQTG